MLLQSVSYRSVARASVSATQPAALLVLVLVLVLTILVTASVWAEETHAFTGDLGRVVEVPVKPIGIAALYDQNLELRLNEICAPVVGMTEQIDAGSVLDFNRQQPEAALSACREDRFIRPPAPNFQNTLNTRDLALERIESHLPACAGARAITL